MSALASQPRHRRRLTRSLRPALGFCAVAMLAAACSTSPDAPAPSLRGPLNGMNVSWWVVDDALAPTSGRETTARAFSPYETESLPFDIESVRACRDNGIRVLAVPAKDLDLLRAKLMLVGPVQDQWYGQMPTWTSIIQGPAWDGTATLGMDDGELNLPPGTMRMLARCWTVPGEPVSDDGARGAARAKENPMSAAIELELTPQHREIAREESKFSEALRTPKAPDARDDGLVFSRLGLRGTCAAGVAYVLIPEDPRTDWNPTRRTQDGDATGADSTIAPPEPPVQGPLFPRLPTLGETLLTDAAGANKGRKVILILEPRAPERFEVMR